MPRVATLLCLVSALFVPVFQFTVSSVGAAASQVTGHSERSLANAHLENFKITPIYDPTFSQLSAEQQKYIKDALLAGALSWFSTVVKVRPLRSSIKLNRECASSNHNYLLNNQRYCRGSCAAQTRCGPVAIPENHLKPCRRCDTDGSNCEVVAGSHPGVTGSHFLLYVSAIEESAKCSRGYTAYGKHCQQEDDFDRPLAGYLNFCPNRISSNPAHYQPLFDQQLSNVLHELLHILVFSDDLFPYYHDEDGYPRTQRSESGEPRNRYGQYKADPNTLRSMRYLHWTTVNKDTSHTVEMMVTPNVVREVRAHFNCSSLVGAELENQGGQGAARMHWEKRIFGEELMSATAGLKPVISRITLALLEDSGWYRVDYSYGGRLQWGYHRGCGFVNESCGGWISYAKDRKISLSPFCDERDYRLHREGCVDHRTRAGPCTLRNYSLPLPTEYQYFNRRKGGSQSFADYCPLFHAAEYQHFRIGRDCRNPAHAPAVNIAMEIYGRNSRCFEQRKPFEMRFNGTVTSQSKYGAGCYEFSCSARRLFIHFAGQLIRCSEEGQKNRVEYTEGNVTYSGTLECPDYNELCSEYDCVNMCSDHGTCVGGYCKCHPGYHGDDCSRSYLERLLSCSNVTCLNGGNCSNTSVGFSCTCPAGFTGAYCESDLVPDPCATSPCGANGTCVRTRGGKVAACDCFEGRVGETCAGHRDYCREAGRPCDHGHCTNNSVSPSCVCDPGYSGRRCRMRVDFCIPNLCQNNSTCVNHLNRATFSCVCPSDFEGERCETRIIDPCLSQPCANGGSCSRRNNTHVQCICAAGFGGDFCTEERTNYCANSPCQNGGTCTSLESGFNCSCAEGFRGKRCQKMINPCRPNPCQNNGVCRRQTGEPRYRCNCRVGYTGSRCELSI